MSVRDVTPHEAMGLIHDDALLLDVREGEEWTAGHAPMATHIPLAELPDHLEELNRDETIVCVCRSGGRSLRAAEFLDEHGFDVVNLAGGMTAWSSEDLPLVSDTGDARIV